ncbi:hypothetical protein QOZ80_5AG0374610 [Eleusine coracana subsp. coracana]|nr:hypothetical protein QOZ80_5AG0374610 [Eleusine coracana subsp. coracana]
MPSLMIESPLQHQATDAWGSMYSDSVQEPVKPRHTLIPAAAAKKPAYGGVRRRRNLETCTEALGCETGAVDTTALPGNGLDVGIVDEVECAERKRRTRTREEDHEDEEAMMAGRTHRSSERRRPLPPPLTTLAQGAGRVRMVHERRDGRLELYAVRMPGVLEAERSGGRLRMRLLPPLAGNAAAAQERQEEPEAEEEVKEAEEEVKEAEEEEYGFSKYVRGGRCVEPEDGAAAARRGKQWELELRHYPCIF